MRRKDLIALLFLLHLSGSTALSQESGFSLYGFFDLEAEVNNKNTAGKIWTFDQHHFNVITIYQMDDQFRAFGEIEWEHGVTLEAGAEGSGLVTVERAWLEYKPSDAFKVKVGKYLPPFGIYNLKHDATPTFLSSFVPNSVYGKHENTLGGKQRLYAKFGTGVQVLGLLSTRDWEGEYYLYLTNGRGPNPSKQDNNPNKGVGGRVVIRPPVGGLGIGASFYTERNGAARNTTQTALGLDATLEFAHLNLESEVLFPSQERVGADDKPNGNFRKGAAFYIQAAYAIGDRLRPFVRYEKYNPDVDIAKDGESSVTPGINFAATSRVYLKAEVQMSQFESPSSKAYDRFVGSVAAAF